MENERQSKEFTGGVTIFFATDTRRRTLTDAEYFRILLHGFLAPRPAELKEAIASRLKAIGRAKRRRRPAVKYYFLPQTHADCRRR